MSSRCPGAHKLVPSSPLIPEAVKVEPIVWSEPGIMFQSIDITLRPMLNAFGPMLAIQDNFVGEFLEIDFVAVPSTINPEEQDDRAMHHGCNHNGANRKSSRGTKEMTLSDFT